ncbi:MAG: branched-chain amino acid ABC transporter permease, partial [Spirochaetota bacterium]
MATSKKTGRQAAGESRASLFRRFRSQMRRAPALGWLIGALLAVSIEVTVGRAIARAFGLQDVPNLFGLPLIFTSPLSFPGALLYVFLVYLVPAFAAALTTAPLTNRAAKLLQERLPVWVGVIIHLALLYGVLHIWGSLNDYRVLLLSFIFIAILLTLSLNLINGYMGEFSCSHPGFMALGAYVSSILSVLLFVNDDVFGAPLLPPALGPFLFPVILIIGGLVSSIGALIVAVPSFGTRGDYLAIISLAFTFIVKSIIENLEIIGGPRGFMNQPKYAGLPVVYVWMVICIWIIYNFTRSTLGKAACAVRDNETAADAMTINTRRTKMVTFLFAAFWAGIAGGLFAHVMGYINPSTFGVLKLSEVLAMVYLGGLNSVIGSIAGAVG